MKCTRFLFLIFLLTTLCSGSQTLASTTPITMHMPKQVLTEALQKSLPIVLSRASESIGGTISVNRIYNLELGDQSISASLGLTGENVQINTKIGGHQIALNVGNVQVDFGIDAKLRFDEATQTLFIRPAITEINQGSAQQENEIGALIASVFRDKEIPVVIDRFQPIITNTGAKQIIIHMIVRNITVRPNGLNLELTPDITTTPLPK